VRRERAGQKRRNGNRKGDDKVLQRFPLHALVSQQRLHHRDANVKSPRGRGKRELGGEGVNGSFGELHRGTKKGEQLFQA